MMRAVAAVFLVLGVAAVHTSKAHLRATSAERPAEEAEQDDVDESSKDTDVPVEVEETDNALPMEVDASEEVGDASESMDTEMDAEHNQLVEELEKSKKLKKNLAQTARRAQQAMGDFHTQERETREVKERLEKEQRDVGSLMDELNKVGHSAEDANRKLKKTESMFEAEQRKNGELMDELRAEQFNAMREEQNQVANEHKARQMELQKAQNQIEQQQKELQEARAHEAELQKKITDLTHAKDLWKSAAVTARKAIQDQKAAKAAKAKKADRSRPGEVDHATLGEAVAMAHGTPAKMEKRVHKEIPQQLIAHEAVKSNASQAASRSLEHVEKPVVQVADDASSDDDGEDDISIISQADDPPLDEAPVTVSKGFDVPASSVQKAPVEGSKSDAETEEDEEVEEEE